MFRAGPEDLPRPVGLGLHPQPHDEFVTGRGRRCREIRIDAGRADRQQSVVGGQFALVDGPPAFVARRKIPAQQLFADKHGSRIRIGQVIGRCQRTRRGGKSKRASSG